MSPSPVPLEVERYIGACLISNHNHTKNKPNFNEQFYVREHYTQKNFYKQNNEVQRCGGSMDGWAGGMPLISYVVNRNHQRHPDFQRNSTPASSDEFNNLARLAVHTQGAPLILTKTYNNRKFANKPQKNREFFPKNKSGNTTDAVSVTSDESYGSTSSDQCLPRIIKPRKRRKKERKLPIMPFDRMTPQDFSSESSISSSPEIVTPISHTGFLSFDTNHHNYNNNNNNNITLPETSDFLKFLNFDSRKTEDEESRILSPSKCQCGLCDPRGQIWDVEKTSYSSFLTPPPAPDKGDDDVFVYPDLLNERLSLLNINDKKCAKSCDKNDRFGDLEVSTEIVTSLNGQRDLEIKFFSTNYSNSNAEHTVAI